VTDEQRLRKRPEWWAQDRPDRAAVVDGDQVLSYADWNHRADQLADALVALDPAAGCAAVMLHQRFEWFVINLALAKLGWDHIAIPWNETLSRRTDMVRACGARIVFADVTDVAPLADAMAGIGATTINCGEPVAGVTSFPDLLTDQHPTPRRSRRNAPLVKYTSGTTGTPRGVRRPEIRSPEEARRRKESSRPPQDLTGVSADWAYEHHHALITLPLHHGVGPRGARVCHAEGGTCYLLDRYDPERALEIIDRAGITHWTTVPTMLQRMRNLPEEVLAGYDVSSMRVLAVGSAPSSMALKRWTLDYFGHTLFEGYGASEVGLVSLMSPYDHESHPGSCGRLRPHVSVRIVDEDGVEVPVGEVGELCIRTPLTIDGYVGEPGDARGGANVTPDGYFKIGDYGRLDADGFLYITGRAKDMVVRGGVNIFPAEIEDVLLHHPQVSSAAVIGVPDEEFGEQLMAFCELRPDGTATVDELRGHAAARLAKHKTPQTITIVPALPRNEMGKVVKARLREKYWDGTGFVITKA
jgi:long-chain acyl-CoA synthetase